MSPSLVSTLRYTTFFRVSTVFSEKAGFVLSPSFRIGWIVAPTIRCSTTVHCSHKLGRKLGIFFFRLILSLSLPNRMADLGELPYLPKVESWHQPLWSVPFVQGLVQSKEMALSAKVCFIYSIGLKILKPD